MSWILEAAVILNGGCRREALLKLADVLDVDVATIRRWDTGKRPIPKTSEMAIRGLLEIRGLVEKLTRIRQAVSEIDNG